MTLLYFKALHLIGVIVWFAGLFYLGRLFVYHCEAHERPEPERRALKAQFALMEKRTLLRNYLARPVHHNFLRNCHVNGVGTATVDSHKNRIGSPLGALSLVVRSPA